MAPISTSTEVNQSAEEVFAYATDPTHIFRKTVATRLDDAGLSARQIADHLGHAKPSMTQDVYMAARSPRPKRPRSSAGRIHKVGVQRRSRRPDVL